MGAVSLGGGLRLKILRLRESGSGFSVYRGLGKGFSNWVSLFGLTVYGSLDPRFVNCGFVAFSLGICNDGMPLSTQQRNPNKGNNTLGDASSFGMDGPRCLSVGFFAGGAGISEQEQDIELSKNKVRRSTPVD